MNNNQIDKSNGTSIDYIVPGQPLYSNQGDHFAKQLFDFLDFITSVASRIRGAFQKKTSG